MEARNGLYTFLAIVLIIILYYTEDENVFFQWLTLLVMLVLLFIVDLVFFQSQRAFIFDPFYPNYQKLTKPLDY
jgi:multisubunit Na+/H+ antiporter MnhB subunit